MNKINDFGESKITVLKCTLLAAIRANRETHRESFLRAQEGYRKAVITELDQMLADARQGRGVRRSVGLIEPQDHTPEYDRVIKMLEMSVADEVTISETQFAHYVQDEWGWKQTFTTVAASYGG